MKTKTKVSWKDFERKAPLPHYLCPDSNIAIEYDEETIEMTGNCLFPSRDKTLKARGHVNHFHVIMLIDVIYALNVLWNSARIVKSKLGWETMLAITTKSKITTKFKLDKQYLFYLKGEKAKMGIWSVTLSISDDENKIIAEVEVKAKVE